MSPRETALRCWGAAAFAVIEQVKPEHSLLGESDAARDYRAVRALVSRVQAGHHWIDAEVDASERKRLVAILDRQQGTLSVVASIAVQLSEGYSDFEHAISETITKAA